MEFLNCEMEFVCPKDWESMVVSVDPNIRHCSTCNKDVYFCHTIDDLKKSINNQQCVTYVSGEVVETSKEFDTLISDLDSRKKPEIRVIKGIRTTGIPKGYTGIQAFLEKDDEEN